MNIEHSQIFLATCLALAVLGCGEPSASETGETETGESTTSETSGTETSGTETGDTGETGETDTDGPQTRGLPEGQSTWTGQMEVNGLLFTAEATFVNTGGDLEASVVVSDHPDRPLGFGSAEFSVTGTHDPGSGLVALSPDAWIVEPPIAIELLGFTGAYDPDTQMLTGIVADFASGTNNTLAGGPATLELVDGPGEPTMIGDEGAALTMGSHTFSGEFQCTTSVREVSGEIVYDGAGRLTGSMTIGDTDLANPLGTFDFSGVHNPTTGGITLIPGLWINPNHNILTFFVDGVYDPSTGMFDGDQGSNANACMPDSWHTIIE